MDKKSDFRDWEVEENPWRICQENISLATYRMLIVWNW